MSGNLSTLDKPPHFDGTHRRYNPLMDEWVIVSPHRVKRPWSGQLEKSAEPSKIESGGRNETTNPLSPGSIRAGGVQTPDYKSTYTFKNDFPALAISKLDCPDSHERSQFRQLSNSLFVAGPARGDCDVMCFHPDTNMTLALMQLDEIIAVIKEWAKLTKAYADDDMHEWIQIFENRGAAVGSSNMHPHCQIWTCCFLPTLAARRCRNQLRYFTEHKIQLLLAYAHQEDKSTNQSSKRIVSSNQDWLVVVPWWACWPFEAMIIPRRRHIRWLFELDESERSSLADSMKDLLTRYDNLFETDFPYTMAWFQAPLPTNSNDRNDINFANHWQLHALYCPPLLRSATVRKFMSGFEIFSEAQRDLLPEDAAERLRSCAPRHFSLQSKYD